MSAARIYGVVIGMAAMFVTARFLGPEGRGVLATIVAWVTLTATMAGLSLGEVSQHRLQKRYRTDWLPEILGTMVFFAVTLSALAGLIVFALYRATDGALISGLPTVVVVVAFIALPLMIWDDYAQYLLFAVGKARTFNIMQMVGGTIGLGSIVLLLVVFGLGVLGALVAQIFTQALMSLVSLVALTRAAAGRLVVSLREAREMAGGALRLHVNTIGVILLAHTDTLMLNHLATTSEVGWYQLGYQLILVMLIVPQAGSMILYSRMAEVGPDQLWVEQKKLIIQVLGLMVLLSSVAYFAAPLAVALLAGAAFEPSVSVFRWLLPVLLGMSLAQLMAPQWIARGIFIPTSILTICAAIANAGLNYLWIPAHGMIGAVWATLVSYFGLVVIVQLSFAVWCDTKHQAVRTGP